MSTPHAEHHWSEATRRYVERIGALYERARSLVSHRSRHDNRLQVWEWHRASAQACVDEASLIYTEGLMALLHETVTVSCSKGLGAPQFYCRVEAADRPAHSFRVYQGVLMDEPQEREAVERLFGGADAEVLEAFAEGLRKLHGLGAFKRHRSITLQPDAEPAASLEPVLAA